MQFLRIVRAMSHSGSRTAEIPQANYHCVRPLTQADRMTVPNKHAYRLAVTALLAAFSASASGALSDQWYVGIGGGVSLLQPDTADGSIDVDEDQGQVGTFFFGRDFDSRSSGQFQLYSLGEAEYSGDQGSASYIAGDASLLYRFLDSRDGKPRGSVFGASLYGRFGFGFIDRDSDQSLDDDTPVYFGVGAGMETYFTNNLGLRLEALYHETDTASATLTLVTRFGGHRRRPGLPPIAPVSTGRPATAPEPAAVPESPDTVEPGPAQSDELLELPVLSELPSPSTAPMPAIDPAAGSSNADEPAQTPVSDSTDSSDSLLPGTDLADTSYPEVEIKGNTNEALDPEDSFAESGQSASPTTIGSPVSLDSLTATDSDEDGIEDGVDRCAASTPGYPVDNRGCSLFHGLLADLTFGDRSAEFSADSYRVMDRLAETLLEYPESYVELVAHTDNRGTEAEQSALTRQRLRAIGVYLVGKGVAQERLLLRSFGAKRPAYDNQSASGQRRNNRIEIFENP